MTEEWRPIPGCDGRYEVSNLGRVRSRPRTTPGRWDTPMHFAGRVLAQESVVGGYLRVGMRYGGRRHRELVHRLVLLAFVGPCPEGMEARHVDGNPTHNHVSNLAWGTHSENTYDQVSAGTHNIARRTHCPQGHPYDEANTYRKPSGARTCRTCKRDKRKAAA